MDFQTLPQSGELLVSIGLWSLSLHPTASFGPAVHTPSPSLNSYKICLLLYRTISYICCLDCVGCVPNCIVTYYRYGRVMMYWDICLNLFSCILPRYSHRSPNLST